jgi:hypothetical protein
MHPSEGLLHREMFEKETIGVVLAAEPANAANLPSHKIFRRVSDRRFCRTRPVVPDRVLLDAAIVERYHAALCSGRAQAA